MNIGRSIRIACAHCDMNQGDLAATCGISRVTISHLVTGKTQCNQKTLETLAAAFDMKVSEFIALGEGGSTSTN